MDFEETGMNGVITPSMTFKGADGHLYGSSVFLTSTSTCPSGEECWSVSNKEEMPLPYFVSNAATLLYAEAMLHGRYDTPKTFMALPKQLIEPMPNIQTIPANPSDSDELQQI